MNFSDRENESKEERSRKLQRCEKELDQTLSKLEWTRRQLIRQRKLSAVGKLSAGIIHEIKNPIGFVNNFSELSLEQLTEFKQQLKESHSTPPFVHRFVLDLEESLHKINEHGNRASDIVQSMLLRSKGEKSIREPTDLNSLIRKFVTLTYHSMRAESNAIQVSIDLDLDNSIGKIPINPEEMSRVIVNLCENAFDAMKAKFVSSNSENSGYEPKLTVRTIRTDKYVSIDIEDNGPGIPEENTKKIMEPFFTTKKKSGGTGLGLSISQDIINSHDGSLSIKSGKEKGIIFKIKLPIR